jgi:hypothetical protein
LSSAQPAKPQLRGTDEAPAGVAFIGIAAAFVEALASTLEFGF